MEEEVKKEEVNVTEETTSAQDVTGDVDSTTVEVNTEDPVAEVVSDDLLSYTECDELAKKIKIEHLANFRTAVKVSEKTWNSLHRHKQINLNGQMVGVPVEVLKGAVEDGQHLWA